MQQATVSGKQKRKKSTESAGDEGDGNSCAELAADDRCDCCSVLTHQKTEIQSADNM